MSEILAAIRRKITEAGETAIAEAAGAPGEGPRAASGETGDIDEVLELTAALNEDGSVRELAPIGGAQHRAPAAAPPAASAELPATTVAGEVEAELTRLAAAAREPHPAPVVAAAAGGRTVEEVVGDLVRPMLRAWLDENLPGLVERLVQGEIERIRRQG